MWTAVVGPPSPAFSRGLWWPACPLWARYLWLQILAHNSTNARDAEPLCLHSPSMCDFRRHDISIFSCRATYGAIEGILRSNTSTRAVLCFEVFEVTLKYRVLKGDQHPPLDFYGRCRCRAWGPLNLGRVYSWRISGPKITGWTGDLWNNQPADVWNNQPVGLTWWKDYK